MAKYWIIWSTPLWFWQSLHSDETEAAKKKAEELEAKAEAVAKLTDAIEKWDERSKNEREERLQKMSQKPESLIEQQAISAALAALAKPGSLAVTVISCNI